MKIIIIGSSGMVGKGVLYECIDSPVVDHVLMINRSHVAIKNSKLEEVIVSDFNRLEDLQLDLSEFDACFFCAGVSSAGMSEVTYSKITYDLTVNFTSYIYKINPNVTFCYVTGTGTDSSEKGRVMWARIKGKTENAILNMGFKSAYMFRPGYIQPMKGIKSKTMLYSLIYLIFKPIYWMVLQFISSSATTTVNMGKAMINVVQQQPEISILHNKDINFYAK